MKFKRSYLFTLPFFGLLLTLGASLAKQDESHQINAYAPASLPTRISLKDASEKEVRSYYEPLASLSETEKTGEALLKHLKPLLKNGQRYWSYESGNNLWKMYEITDRDWVKSPASQIPGYNPETQEIVNYTYGSSNTSPGPTDPFVRALYVNRDVDNLSKAWGNHNQDQWGINREHIWPKSQGFNSKGNGGARGDPMHLWPGNGRVNGTEHSNSPYGFVDLSKPYTDPVSSKGWTNLSGNYGGVSLTLPAGDNVFEPQDCDKGDIARSVFYMAARYQFVDPNDSDPLSVDNPNLKLVQEAKVRASYDSSLQDPGTLGILSDLLAWNRMDPPDEFEIHRNNLLYHNFTGNRNPFIDFPSWAEAIWGSVVYEGRNFVSYDPQDLTPIDPRHDTLNDFASEVENALTLSATSLTLKEGETGSVTAWSKDNANISWTSLGEGLKLQARETASGEPLNFQAMKAGEYEIKASATSLGKAVEASAKVVVLPKEETGGGYVKLSADQMEVRVGDRASFSAISSIDSPIRYVCEDANIELSQAETSSGELVSFLPKEAGTATIRAVSMIDGKEVQSALTVHILPAPETLPSLPSATNIDRLDTNRFTTSGTSYVAFDSVRYEESGTTYSAVLANNEKMLQLNTQDVSKNRYPGFVMIESKSEVEAVRFTFGAKTVAGRTVLLYGKTQPYASPKDLYDPALRGELLGEAIKGDGVIEIKVNGNYPYIGFASKSGALYLESVEVVHKGATPIQGISALQKTILYPGEYIRMSALEVHDDAGRELYPFDLLLEDGSNALEKRLTYEEVSPGRQGSLIPCRVRYHAGEGRILETSIELQAKRKEAPLVIARASDLSDFLMSQDQAGQCVDRYVSAKESFLQLDEQEKALFMKSDDPLLRSARNRLHAWASYHNEVLIVENHTYVFVRDVLSFQRGETLHRETLLAILLIALAGFSSVAFFIRHKKKKSISG